MLNHSHLYSFDISIIVEEEDDKPPYCLFASIHLTELTDPKEIWARGMSLLSLYNGLCNLYINPTNGDYPSDLKLNNLYSIKSNHDLTPVNTHEIVQTHPFSTSIPQLNNSDVKSNPLSYYLNLAKTEKDVLNILLQLGNGLDWINLYSILDSLKTFSKIVNRKHFNVIVKNSGYTLADIKAFTGTANNYGLIGVSARHGFMTNPPPAITMSLRESQKLILELCKSYLANTHPK
jgi:pSer/pThr/pTyr-binding forkhead associated (FHA) protein